MLEKGWTTIGGNTEKQKTGLAKQGIEDQEMEMLKTKITEITEIDKKQEHEINDQQAANIVASRPKTQRK